MTEARAFDVIVTGAGPAGVCAAIGLRRLGYSVALLERQPFPRAHIGEALTPGVPSILEFLDIADVLNHVPKMASTGTLRLWDHRSEATQLPAAGGFVTDRSWFDRQMQRTAQARDVKCHPCRQFAAERERDHWNVDVMNDHGTERLTARLWIDARGRQAARASSYVATAPAAIALWAEFTAVPSQDPAVSRIEALRDAWLWGAATAAGTYRVLAVTDPRFPRTETPGSPETWLRAAIARSTLMRSFAGQPFLGATGQCAAGPYVHSQPWQAGFMKAGDAAFALDPLSSGGVEKAMRHALQCVVAANTFLDAADATAAADLAHRYYMDRLLESVASHACWTERFYGDAWAANEAFWMDRSQARVPADDNERSLASRLARQLDSARSAASTLSTTSAQPAGAPRVPDDDLAQLILSPQTSVMLSPDTQKVETLCVVDSKATNALAVSHPSLARPVAFLDDVAIAPMLADLDEATNLNKLVLRWSASMPRRQAMQIACRLIQDGILVTCQDGRTISAAARETRSAGRSALN